MSIYQSMYDGLTTSDHVNAIQDVAELVGLT